MAKPNFTLPNKPAIKSGSILSYNYTDDFTFVPAPLTFNRDSAATRVNEKGLIEDVGYFGPELIQNGDFSEIGPELITNGGFDTDSDWTKETGWSIEDGVANFNDTIASADAVLRQDNLTLTNGNTYKLSFNVNNTSGTGQIKFLATGGGTDNIEGYEVYSGVNTLYFTPTADRTTLKISGRDTYGSFTIDNVSVKEVGQNWTFGTGWSVDQANSKAVYSDGAKFSQIKQQLINNSTSTYQLSFDAVVNAGQFRIKFGSNNYNIISQSGSYKVNGVFNTTNTFITFEDYDDISSDFSITNISVIEVLGDKPRIDYSDSLTEPFLLLEPQSTNLVEYSEDFTTRGSLWQTFGNANKTLLAAISPDGKKTAALITGLNGAGDNDFRYAFPFNTANKTLTYSVYLKGSGTLRLQISNGVDQAFQNIITLTPDWKRHYITASFNSTSVNTVYLVLDDLINLTATEYYVWGAQFEELSYSTSYIPTAGSTATRLSETANNAGDVNVFNSEEGVLYFEFKPLSDNVLSNQRSIQLEGLNGASDNEIIIQYLNSNLRFLIYGNSVLQLQREETVSLSSYTKVALLYKNDVFKIYINGTEIYTASGSYTMPIGLNKINFNRSGVSNFYGNVRNAQVFNKALTDRELEILTIQ